MTLDTNKLRQKSPESSVSATILLRFISFPGTSSTNDILLCTKIVLTYCEKKKSSYREKLLKFKAEGREFANILRSLEQFFQTGKGKNIF